MIYRTICSLLVFLVSALPARAGENTKTALQLNWKPEPEFGGFYAAQEKGIFKQHNLEVEIVPGGSGTPTVQLVGAGKVAFGIVSADELVIARARGNKVVALFAVYQTNPQGIMTRKSRGMKSIEDIFKTPGTLAIQRGLPYASFLEKKFGFDKLRIVPAPFGDLSKYRTDEDYAMQCFVTSEPLAAKKIGIEPQTFLIADAGWNPYTAVVAAREDYVREHPDVVAALVKAMQAGWEAYLSDPHSTNELMSKLNPTMSLAVFEECAEAQVSLIKDAATKADLGAMSDERWRTLIDQLKELKLIPSDFAIEPRQCFVTLTGK